VAKRKPTSHSKSPCCSQLACPGLHVLTATVSWSEKENPSMIMTVKSCDPGGRRGVEGDSFEEVLVRPRRGAEGDSVEEELVRGWKHDHCIVAALEWVHQKEGILAPRDEEPSVLGVVQHQRCRVVWHCDAGDTRAQCVPVLGHRVKDVEGATISTSWLSGVMSNGHALVSPIGVEIHSSPCRRT
jgi:hypothetical protein